jgi:hypothetical protein
MFHLARPQMLAVVGHVVAVVSNNTATEETFRALYA